MEQWVRWTSQEWYSAGWVNRVPCSKTGTPGQEEAWEEEWQDLSVLDMLIRHSGQISCMELRSEACIWNKNLKLSSIKIVITTREWADPERCGKWDKSRRKSPPERCSWWGMGSGIIPIYSWGKGLKEIRRLTTRMQPKHNWQPAFGEESTSNTGDLGSIPGSERSPGVGDDNPLQYACLENLVDRGAWQAIVHGVTKSQTQLSI